MSISAFQYGIIEALSRPAIFIIAYNTPPTPRLDKIKNNLQAPPVISPAPTETPYRFSACGFIFCHTNLKIVPIFHKLERMYP